MSFHQFQDLIGSIVLFRSSEGAQRVGCHYTLSLSRASAYPVAVVEVVAPHHSRTPTSPGHGLFHPLADGVHCRTILVLGIRSVGFPAESSPARLGWEVRRSGKRVDNVLAFEYSLAKEKGHAAGLIHVSAHGVSTPQGKVVVQVGNDGGTILGGRLARGRDRDHVDIPELVADVEQPPVVTALCIPVHIGQHEKEQRDMDTE
eukprot:3654740-Pyramimonas_sp.AAC.1